MSQWEWEAMMERRYDTMPSWWWNAKARKEAYDAWRKGAR
jgi:hypothetical protein